MHTFSRRTAWDTTESAFAAAIRSTREDGRVLCDLTLSNPTQCGFRYDEEAILSALSAPEALLYGASPLGSMTAREAVCQYYTGHGAVVDPDRVVLTASTSEAYAWLFRLLCDAGDVVLAPQPGYPLFDYLADIEDVTLGSYLLFDDFGWWIDFAALERTINARTRAIIVVHPGNPTGHWTHRDEKQKMVELCKRRRLALIVDEVFLDYPTREAGGTFAVDTRGCLTFVLSGLSKVAGLPQMKVGWVVVGGEGSGEAMRRLEVIADTFLSVAGPAQGALTAWLAARHGIQSQIRDRVLGNLEAMGRSGLDYLPVEAGWSVVARLRGERGDAEQVLTQLGVIVHPGSLYGLSGPGRVVLSLITTPDAFVKGIRLMA